MRRPFSRLAGAAALFGLLLSAGWPMDAAEAARIKDVSSIQGVRENQLVGYGLVMGLQGTGDTLRNTPFTGQSMQSMLDRMGINVQGLDMRARNVAAVTVTASLPAFAGLGSQIDVNVSSLGDATSLKGGTLLMTPLSGGDGIVYAVAQGPIAVSGFALQGQAESVTQGVPTAGRIPNGALVERRVAGSISDSIVLQLKNPDFMTAALIVDAVNAFTSDRYGMKAAKERDLASVTIQKPKKVNVARFLAEIGELEIQPDIPARVVVDQRTGTVVIGNNVRISTVALAHGNMTVRVTETPQVSQPGPFSNGTTQVVPRTNITVDQQDAHLAMVGGTDLQTLVHGLNRLGLKPTDMISILQAIKTSGALQAELIVQ